MARLNRAQAQELNRAKVLAAAKDEFTERGFRDAKIDAIAERADLTRGGVYSNFPSKRALYLAVLAEQAANTPAPPHARPGTTTKEALGAFARAWITRHADHDEALHRDLMPEIVAEERIRRPYTQLLKLNALLLALALEQLEPQQAIGRPQPRLVRLAETTLTMLHGADQVTAAAPGFIEPFDIVSACEQLASLTLNDWWAPPHHTATPRPTDQPWTPPQTKDALTKSPANLTDDGVVAVLGLHRLTAIEDIVRATPNVTLAIVTHEPDELGPLARLTLAELGGCLRQAFRESEWPKPHVICDETGTLAAAAGVPAVSNETEAAVRIEAGRRVAYADGHGAGSAVTDGRGSSQPARSRPSGTAP